MHKYKFIKRMQDLAMYTVIPRDAKKSTKTLAYERARDSLLLAQVTAHAGITIEDNTFITLTADEFSDLMYNAFYAGHLAGEFKVEMTEEEFAEVSHLFK